MTVLFTPPSELIALLASVVKLDSPIYRDAHEKARAFPPDIHRHIVESHIKSPVEALLKGVEPFASGLMLNGVDGASGFNADEASSFLVRQVLRDGLTPEAAVQTLSSLLAKPAADATFVMLLWGVEFAVPFALTDEISLVPVSSLPSHPLLQGIQEAAGKLDDPLTPHYFRYAPWAAITIRSRVAPLWLKQSRTSFPPRLASEQADSVRLALTCIGPSAPVPAVHWFQYADNDVQAAQVHSGYGAMPLEVVPAFPGHRVQIGEDDARAVVLPFLGLHNDIRRKLTLALERLNLSLRRLRLRDRVIDLAIALESLLVPDRGESTFKLGLRSALLYPGTLAEKKRARAVTVALYALRSEAVHTAEVSGVVKVHGIGKLDSDTVASEATERTAAIIRALISKGSLPDWNDLELQPKP